jgi:hypothetical protein
MQHTGFFLIATLALGACDKFGGSSNEAQGQVDPSMLSSSGEVALADGGSMPFDISSEQYKQWDQARRAFPKSLITRFGQVLQPRAPTERSIANAVALLEGNAQAKRAIEGAGLSVRGFVEITVALEQQMLAATSRGSQPARVEPMYPMTMDTGYYQIPTQPSPDPVTAYPPVSPYPPATPTPATPYPAASVLPPPRDTVRRDTIVSPVPTPKRDSMPPRRDTVPVRRDSVPPPRRDTAAAAPPAPAPPDSIARS